MKVRNIAVLVIFLSFFFSFVHTWFESFRKRQIVEVKNDEAFPLLNYHVEVNVSTLGCVFSEFCYDISFTDLDDTPLEFWIESGCRTSNTTIWIEVPEIPSGETKKLFFYYSDPSMNERLYEKEWNSVFGYPSTENCENNDKVRWDSYDDKFPLGYSLNLYNNLTDYFGGEINVNNDHTHPYPTMHNTTSNDWCFVDPCGETCVTVPTISHLHEISFQPDGSVSSDSNNPKYKSFIFCHEKNKTARYSQLPLPINTIAMFEEVFSFDDWVEEEEINDQNLYIRGNPTYGSILGEVTHNHKLPSIVDMVVIDRYFDDEIDEGSAYVPSFITGHDHKHETPECFTEETINSPAYTFVHFQKTIRSTKFISGMILLINCDNSSLICDIPLGWDLYLPLLGRFPRGSNTITLENRFGGVYYHNHVYACLFNKNDDGYVTPFGDGSTDEEMYPLGCLANHNHFYSGTVEYSHSLPEFQFSTFIKRRDSSFVDVVVQPTVNFTCYGEFWNIESKVCYGHGECVDHNTCECDDYYYGENCNITTCFGYLRNETSDVCSARGDCVDFNKCQCYDKYHGLTCNISTCFGILENYTNEVCYSHGKCIDIDKCICSEHYYDLNCNITTCYGYFRNETNLVCSGHGDCDYFNHCDCDDNYDPGFCNTTTCEGTPTGDINVCNGHGECLNYEHCSCNDKFYGRYCDINDCFGVLSNYSESCNFGSCEDKDSCDCEDNYWGTYCNETSCHGYLFNDTKNVCSGHGNCVEFNHCECPYMNYTETEKCEYNCYGKLVSSELVCSSHGSCTEYDTCVCESEDYSGERCHIYSCFGISVINETVCSGHGKCYDVNNCMCQQGYSSSSFETPCDEWYCGELEMDDPNVCTNRGSCVKSHECKCRDNYIGKLCEDWECGFDSTSPLACSGSGECISPDVCECDNGYIGDNCETNIYLATIMAPILTITGIGIFVTILLSFCGCCVLFCFVLCSFCMVFGCIVCCLCGLVLRLFGSVRRFGKLENFDLLLKEQELESDTSIAHLKIKKELFQVEFDEIDCRDILGEGGSNSIVYKAIWKRRAIAFKCFKTRMLCQSQDSFDEFEREVEVMANLSHPNVIQFYGASMKPPRVGILMELCEKGELLPFIKKFRKEKLIGYPFREKLRMCSEIISSMEYLHSRNIIHRDLKSENVLVSKEESCKLMDFGLSRVLDRMSVQKTMRVGTNVYMAPEIITTGDYNEKCDVFSFGILIWVIITEETNPYEDEFQVEMRVSQDENYRPSEKEFSVALGDEKISYDWLQKSMIKCWSGDPEKRMSFSDLGALFETNMNKVELDIKIKQDFEDEEKKKNEEDIQKSDVFLEKENEGSKANEFLNFLATNEELVRALVLEKTGSTLEEIVKNAGIKED